MEIFQGLDGAGPLLRRVEGGIQRRTGCILCRWWPQPPGSRSPGAGHTSAETFPPWLARLQASRMTWRPRCPRWSSGADSCTATGGQPLAPLQVRPTAAPSSLLSLSCTHVLSAPRFRVYIPADRPSRSRPAASPGTSTAWWTTSLASPRRCPRPCPQSPWPTSRSTSCCRSWPSAPGRLQEWVRMICIDYALLAGQDAEWVGGAIPDARAAAADGRAC